LLPGCVDYGFRLACTGHKTALIEILSDGPERPGAAGIGTFRQRTFSGFCPES
jgi:hypothetical protein